MLTKIIVFSFLQNVFRQDAFTADALKINADTSQMSSLSKKAVDITDKCQVAGHEVDPIVKSVSTFFGQKHIPIYPWAITMLGALRWGGIAVNLKEGEFTLDHDLDFLVAAPSQTLADCEKLVKEYQSYLYTNFGFSSYAGNNITMGNSQFGLNNIIRVDDHFHYLVVVEKPSAVGHKMVNTDALERTLEKIHGLQVYMAAQQSESLAGNSSHDVSADHFRFAEFMADPNQPFYNPRGVMRTKRPWQQVKSEMLKLFFDSRWARNDHTLVDLWFEPSKDLSKILKPSQTKVLFNGEIFPFPEDQNYIFESVRHTFGQDHPAFHTTNLCDFYKPHRLFEEDALESEEIMKITTDCTLALTKQSFASFHSICPNGIQ